MLVSAAVEGAAARRMLATLAAVAVKAEEAAMEGMRGPQGAEDPGSSGCMLQHTLAS